MKVLQINTTVNSGSTGRIAEEIGLELIKENHESCIAFGREGNPSKNDTIRIGNNWDNYKHGLKTMIFDRHGFGSKGATSVLIDEIEKYKPDVIGLHNLHGYYLHIGLLFEYLGRKNLPVVWTLFDCWAFTGHCTYYDSIACTKWQSECHNCPKKSKYPSSFFLDQSRRNFHEKKLLFHKVKNMHLVVHSNWLKKEVEKSFLHDFKIHHIYNGTNVDVFKPRLFEPTNIILGVASTWDERKGLKDFVELREHLPNNFEIVLIGLTKNQIDKLPMGIKGIERTESVQELADWYSRASFFVNPTYQDNFPTTNIEALACGTPVITYNTGGSPEAVDAQTGRIVEKGKVKDIVTAINEMMNFDQREIRRQCRERALNEFNKEKQYAKYIDIFKELTLNKI